MLVDTDIFIWSFRGNSKAIEFLDSLSDIYISDVTYMELIQGAKNKQEANYIDGLIEDSFIKKIPINELISQRASKLVRDYFLSHSMQMGDALIAATALEYGLDFSSGNAKHYSYIESLKFFPFKPQ